MIITHAILLSFHVDMPIKVSNNMRFLWDEYHQRPHDLAVTTLLMIIEKGTSGR